MIDNIIGYSIRNKFVIGILVLALIGWGIYALTRLPVDAVPDITNNQVQIITTSPSLATQEVEQFITSPVELGIRNIPGVEEVRSISRFGLSVVTVVFEERMGTYLPRQLVSEALLRVAEDIPESLGSPEMAPISTGLGEIVQYTLRAAPGYELQFDPMQLRTLQDWVVARQLSGVPGVVEINSLGGFLKQYEIAVKPERLRATNITLGDLLMAIESSNENTGGSYIEKSPNTYFIRVEGLVGTLEDIGNTVVTTRDGIPLLVKHIADVKYGHAPRFGAITMDGHGEVVGGIVMMLKGANSSDVTTRVMKRLEEIRSTLPKGILLETFLVRDKLVRSAIHTVRKNLLEGGLIVVFVLVLLLGSLRGGLIVASVIPLSMLFAFGCMHAFGVSANLMSLGAIDFGLIVDGAVIIVEGIMLGLHRLGKGRVLSRQEMNDEVLRSSGMLMRPASFGVLIILIVYLPILALTGIEGKMFRPMGLTVSFALFGALLLSLTYVPMMSALCLKRKINNTRTFADRIMKGIERLYAPSIRLALRAKGMVVLTAAVLLAVSLWVFSRMGGEFIPTLDEGDLALHQILPPGSSLQHSIDVSQILQEKLLSNFPEVEKVVTKIGSAEVPTDPMPIETGDIMVIMKPRSKWTSASSRQEMFAKMEGVLNEVPGVKYEFSQPIQMRFNELMTGARGDIAVKIFGDDLSLLYENGKEAERLIRNINGVGSARVEQIVGMPQITVKYDYARMAQYGLKVRDVNRYIRAAFAGESLGLVYEDDRRFDLVVRLDEAYRSNLENIRNLYITLPNDSQVPLSQVASVDYHEAPMQISRDNARRRIVVSVNAGSRDVESLVKDIRASFSENLHLPPGYHVTFGGQFENLVEARQRLSVAVPVALALIFVLLYFTFNSVVQAALIFTAIPLSAIGGIWALWIRGMPFSISAGIGFIALFGVAVLNGIVLISYFEQLRRQGIANVRERILTGTHTRLRPVIMTAAVASLGFLPMAISTSGGAEVQRPLATVVIGGLISATLLTLVVLPILYSWLSEWKLRRVRPAIAGMLMLLCGLFVSIDHARAQSDPLTLEDAIAIAIKNNPRIQLQDLHVVRQERLLGSGLELPPTVFSYAGDGLGRSGDLSEHTWGVSQSIALPAYYKSRNAVLGSELAVVEAERSVSIFELQREVTLAYYDLLAARARSELCVEMDSTYSTFADYARLRNHSGIATPLEESAVLIQQEAVEVLHAQALLEIARYQGRLQYLLVSDTVPVVVVDTLTRFAMDVDTAVADHALLRWLEVSERLEADKVAVARSQLLPQFEIGYGYQVFSGVTGLAGVQMSMKLPLHRKPQKQRVQAAEADHDIVRSQYQLTELRLRQRQAELHTVLKMYSTALDSYESRVQGYAGEILRAGALNYQNGQIDYLEYLQLLDRVFQLRKKYVDDLAAYNRAMIELMYLIPQLNQN